MKNNVRKLTAMGMLTALSVVLVALIHFPIFPAAPFLEYDPADIPILICGFAFGPVAGLCVTLIASVIQGLTVSASSGIYGIIMHFIATGVYVSVTSIIYSRHKTKKGAIIALLIGTVAMAAVMVPANYWITSYFMSGSTDAFRETQQYVVTLLVPVIIPFNLIKAGINGVVTFLLYKSISRLIHRGESKNASAAE
jgi:riboflavin transporter FmnP